MDFLSELIQIEEEIDLIAQRNAAIMCGPYVDTMLEDWFEVHLELEASPPAPPEEVQDQDDSLIWDLVCPEDTAGVLEVPPDFPVPPADTVPPMVPPYTDAPPTYEAPPPTPALPPCFIPSITDTPPIIPSPSVCSVRPRSPSPPRPYVKKPPNSFMLFRQEQRPHVVARYNIKDCATVNKVLGQMWKSLSDSDKEKYHQQQREESDRHYELHPAWTPNKTDTKRKSDSQTGTEEPKKRRKKRKQLKEPSKKSKDDDDDDENQMVEILVFLPTKSFCSFWEEQRSHLIKQDTYEFSVPKQTVEQMWDSLAVEDKDVFYRLGHGLAVKQDENDRTS